VLTVHSPFRLENHTAHALAFTLHLLRAPGPGSSGHGLGSGGQGSIVRVPSAGPLAPGTQCYLPVPAVWCAPVPGPECMHASRLIPPCTVMCIGQLFVTPERTESHLL
jgi:hypothetical protein